MTSHLNISYGTSMASAGSTANTGAVASALGNGATSGGALGFLTALVDQLLGGAATEQAGAQATDGADAARGANLSAPVPFGVALDPSAIAAASDAAQSAAAPLLKTLSDALKQFKAELDAGKPPDPDLLKKLGDTAQALAALIPVPTTFTADPTPPPSDVSTGAMAPSSVPTSPSPDSISAQPAQTLANFAQQLTSIAQQVAPVSAQVADQLQTLSSRLDAAAGDPQLLVQLAPNASGQKSALETIVESLTASNPVNQPPAAQLVAAPQLGPAQLDTSPPPATDDSAPTAAVTPAAPPTITLTPVATRPASAAGGGGQSADGRASDHNTDADAGLLAAASAPIASTQDSSASSAGAAGVGAPTPAPTQGAVPSAVPAAYQSAQNPINMGQLAFELVRQVQQGTSRFTIRLDPPELGRVDVKMNVDASGAVSAKLTVDRSETLDMFQRDRGSLEKALMQAGLDGSKTSLEFSLRQNPFTGGDQRQSAIPDSGGHFSPAASDDAATTPAVTLYRGVASAGGVNLFV